MRISATITLCAVIFASPALRADTRSPETWRPPWASAAGEPDCPPANGDADVPAQVLDARTLTLGNGTEFRLSGILPPSTADLPADVGTWPLEGQAREALLNLLSSDVVFVAPSPPPIDRYGRRVGQGMTASTTATDTAKIWLQGEMVRLGYARVAPTPGFTSCTSTLLLIEREARAARHGLWSNAAYRLRRADATRELKSLTGTFQIVEGRVAAVGSSRERVYLNFGANWRWDFTAALGVRGPNERALWVERLKPLQGRMVRVRGWIVQRNGPFVDLTTPHLIEVID